MFHCGTCGGPILFESAPGPAPALRYLEDRDPPGAGYCLWCARSYVRLVTGEVVASEHQSVA